MFVTSMSNSKLTPSHDSTAQSRLATSAAAEGARAVGSAAAEAVSALSADPSLLLTLTSGDFGPDAAATALRDAAPDAVCAGISVNGASPPPARSTTAASRSPSTPRSKRDRYRAPG